MMISNKLVLILLSLLCIICFQPDTVAKNKRKTAIYGKWHLGHLKPFLPLQQEFDDYVGVPYSNDMWKWTYDMQLATEEHHARKASYPND